MIVEQQGVVAVTPGEHGVVQHHDHGHPALRCESGEMRENAGLVTQVQMLQRLIQQIVDRLLRQHQGQAGPLALAAGQAREGARGKGGELQQLQLLSRDRLVSRARPRVRTRRCG